MTEVLLRCDHFLGISHGVSKDCYGVTNELVGEQRKGNAFSVNVFVEMFRVLHSKKWRRKDL